MAFTGGSGIAVDDASEELPSVGYEEYAVPTVTGTIGYVD